jgi:hypothetical protein
MQSHDNLNAHIMLCSDVGDTSARQQESLLLESWLRIDKDTLISIKTCQP